MVSPGRLEAIQHTRQQVHGAGVPCSALVAGTRAGAQRIRQWEPTAWERQMAGQAERLAELVAAGEAALAGRLPRQLVHGDFWDGNVFFRGENPVFVADFGFMAERARIDDRALQLVADIGPWHAGLP